MLSTPNVCARDSLLAWSEVVYMSVIEPYDHRGLAHLLLFLLILKNLSDSVAWKRIVVNVGCSRRRLAS